MSIMSKLSFTFCCIAHIPLPLCSSYSFVHSDSPSCWFKRRVLCYCVMRKIFSPKSHLPHLGGPVVIRHSCSQSTHYSIISGEITQVSHTMDNCIWPKAMRSRDWVGVWTEWLVLSTQSSVHCFQVFVFSKHSSQSRKHYQELKFIGVKWLLNMYTPIHWSQLQGVRITETFRMYPVRTQSTNIQNSSACWAIPSAPGLHLDECSDKVNQLG